MKIRLMIGVAGLLAADLMGGVGRTYDVMEFGARGNGRDLDTAALQSALDACAKTGGRVEVPKGTYLTGTLMLGSKTELHLKEGAKLLGSGKLTDYNPDDVYPRNWCSTNEGWSAKHLIIAYRVDEVKITGKGVIDGNAPAFMSDWVCPVGEDSVCWRDGMVNARDYQHCGRPGQEIVFLGCRNVAVEGVTLQNMCCWSCFFHGCAGVRIRNVKVRNDLRHLNTDGFDIDSCRDVVASGCDIETGDDAFAVRGSPNLPEVELPSRICEDVTISNCTCAVSADGVRVGVGEGTIRKVRISDLDIRRAGRGLHLQCCYGAKGAKGVDISDVKFSDIRIRNAANAILVGAGRPYSKAHLKDITFTRVDVEALVGAMVIGSGATRPKNVAFEDCRIKILPSKGLPPDDNEAGKSQTAREAAIRLSSADSVRFERCSLEWDSTIPQAKRRGVDAIDVTELKSPTER